VTALETPFADYGSAYRAARTAGLDYVILLSCEETERELTVSGVVYSARTGTETAHIRVYRTGNDRVSSALRRFLQAVTDTLPVRGKIIARNGGEALIDLGTAEGIARDAQFTVVKAGKLLPKDSGPGLAYSDADALGTITISAVDEAVSAGILARKGFFDMVNLGDEVLPVPPAAQGTPQTPGSPQPPLLITDTQGADNTTARIQALLEQLRGLR
jgi:hypothetical protein